jgi:hypothetical protein
MMKGRAMVRAEGKAMPLAEERVLPRAEGKAMPQAAMKENTNFPLYLTLELPDLG